MIEGILGPPGAGKSACAVLRMLSAAPHRRCYSNLYPRDHELWEWLDWPGMREAGEGLFVVDEAQVWFGSRTFKENTSELSSWQQSRKRGADLVWVAQHENRVDVAIRELTTLYWRPKIIGPMLVATAEDPDTAERRAFRWWWLNRAFGLYHTDQVVGGREDPPRLARVAGPEAQRTPLYCERPTHTIVDRDGFSQFREYRESDRDIPGAILVYRDYSGDFWMVDPEDLSVIGKLYETFRGHLQGFRRMLSLAAKERAAQGATPSEAAALAPPRPGQPPFGNTGVTVTDGGVR